MTTSTPPAPRRLLKSVLLSMLVLTVGAAASYRLSQLRQPPELKDPTPREYKVEVYSVCRDDLQEIINAFGTARPEKEVVLSAQVAGEVSETHPQLDVGLSVKSHSAAPEAAEGNNRYVGDLLVRIDPSSYEERVAAARHRLAEDQSELRRIEQEETNLSRVYEKIVADWKDSQREYQKMVSLREKGVTTDSDLRRAQMDLRQHEKAKIVSNNERDLLPLRREQAERRIESHTTDLKLSELDLARTFVRPSFDGVLSTVHVERGQYVRVGEPLLTITAVDKIEIPLSVTLADYAKLLPDPDVLKRHYPKVELAENETAKPRWKGHVVRVSPKVDEQTRTATVFVRVDNAAKVTPLLPGTFVHARIDGPQLNQVMAVPREAVLDGNAYVFHDRKFEKRSVVVSRLLHGLALIESGLKTGDRIALTHLEVLTQLDIRGDTGRPITVGRQPIFSISNERTLAEELAHQRTPSAKLIDPAPR